MTQFRTQFRNAIGVHMERHRMSRSGFGRETMDDPSFVFRLDDGRDPRLDTVDKLLVLMGKEPIGPRFLDEVRAFLDVTGMKRSEFGRGVNGNRSFATWLLDGGLPRLGTMDKARAFMADQTNPAEREAIRAAVEDGLPRTRSGGAPAVPVGASDGEEMEMDGDVYMDTKETAKFLKLSYRTLQTYRGTGKGPPFCRFGKAVRYLRSRVVEWAAEREARSTTEADEKERENDVATSPRSKDDSGRRDK